MVLHMKKLHVTNIRLDDNLKAALLQLAASDDRPLASYIVHVLKSHVATKAISDVAKKPRSRRNATTVRENT